MLLEEKIPCTKGLYSLMGENIMRCNGWKFKTGKIERLGRERGQTVEGGRGFVILLHLEIRTGGQPR